MARLFRRVDLAAGINVHLIEVDRNSKIHPNFSHRFTEISKRTFGIRASVANYDEMAAAQHHFIKSEVFEMAAIGEIHVWTFGVRQAQGFVDNWLHTALGISKVKCVIACLTRVSQPRAKSHIEQCQNEGDK